MFHSDSFLVTSILINCRWCYMSEIFTPTYINAGKLNFVSSNVSCSQLCFCATCVPASHVFGWDYLSTSIWYFECVPT